VHIQGVRKGKKHKVNTQNEIEGAGHIGEKHCGRDGGRPRAVQKWCKITQEREICFIDAIK
jgi:hypothetical protein